MYRQIPDGAESPSLPSMLIGNRNLLQKKTSDILCKNQIQPKFVEISLKALPLAEDTGTVCLHRCTTGTRRKAKRLSDRRMRNVLFGSGNESRRFSADLNRWSSRSADQEPPVKCRCSTCPVHGSKSGQRMKPDDSYFSQKIQTNVFSVASSLKSSVVLKTENPSTSSLVTNTSNSTDLPVETVQLLFFQVFIPFLVAGFGNVAVGLLLAHVQHWQVFKSLHGLMMLTSAFLGFKGKSSFFWIKKGFLSSICGLRVFLLF